MSKVVINTAFVFTLCNLTLCLLSAINSSINYNTMLIQNTILPWIFLGEIISLQEGICDLPPKVVPMFKLGYGKTIKEAEYVKEAL